MFAEFHFLRPYWFLALLPLALLLWLSYQAYRNDSGWQNVCDGQLLPHLLMIHRSATQGWWLSLLGLGWLLAILALAGPTWSKQAQPVFSTQKGRVIVLDLSRSMVAVDLKPTRLVRARFKVADIVARSKEGQTGLVVFAGDAFVVSPLTQDTTTITALLPPLDPTIMPVQGSRSDLGLRKAAALLQQAGFEQGDILLVADNIHGDSPLATVRELRSQGFRVSVLVAGTREGAPIPVPEGGFLKDQSGNIVIPRPNFEAMETLAREGGGRYAVLSNDNTDLDHLLVEPLTTLAADVQGTDQETVVWREEGPWLVLCLVPLAALAFRRGWLLMALALAMPPPSWALSWTDLWQRRDQQTAQALEQGDFERAAALATDPMQSGIAAYRQGRFEQAATAFAQASGAHAHYNRGNALTRLGRYEDALAAYDAALAEKPAMQDAKANRALVEALLRQQRQSKQPPEQPREQQAASQKGQQNQHDGSHNNPSQGSRNSQQQGGDLRKPADASEPESNPSAQQTQPSQTTKDPHQNQATAESALADNLRDAEGQQMMEQWLQRIPDDPGGLLRRKFRYQYQRRGGQGRGQSAEAW